MDQLLLLDELDPEWHRFQIQIFEESLIYLHAKKKTLSYFRHYETYHKLHVPRKPSRDFVKTLQMSLKSDAVAQGTGCRKSKGYHVDNTPSVH
jgi:hypothetical protein